MPYRGSGFADGNTSSKQVEAVQGQQDRRENGVEGRVIPYDTDTNTTRRSR
jgi:hypothetical protein